MKMLWYMHTMEYYLGIKKKEIMPFKATWMDLEIVILTEVSQRKTNAAYHLYVESLKRSTNKPIHKTDLQIF